MFSRAKVWFRSIISEEVAKVSASLKQESEEAIATIKNVENEAARFFTKEVEAFKASIKATLQAEHDAFIADLRAARSHIGNGEPSHWTADAETLASDHALKVKK